MARWLFPLLRHFRGHLVKDHSALIARMRDLLAGIHPGLERVLDPTNLSGLTLLTRYVTPAQARTAGLIKELAAELLRGRERLKRVATEIAAIIAARPDAAIIASLPGTGPTLTAEFLAIVGNIGRFDSGDALAAASGLTPKLTHPGKVRYCGSATGGDKSLKRVFCQSAFCAIKHDPASRTFYDRTRAEGKRHHQALIALARRRANVLFAMIRDHEPYRTRPQLRLAACLHH